MQEDNVKVAVRVRPLLPKEKLAGEQVCVRLVPNSMQVVLGKDRAFTFDFAFSAKVTQEDVYKQCVEPLVKSIFEGYNSTVFAYGQTGSGKTYTIGGGDIASFTEEEYGVIPRALNQMFDIMKANCHVTYDIRMSYIEIYKEELRDLLDLETSSKDLHVREDEKGNTLIVGAREERVTTLDEVMSLLESGSAARHTGSTQMNEHSSRSHSVFTVWLTQQWSDQDLLAEKRVQDSSENLDDQISHNMTGKFHFVDLAGSERAHRTGNVGDRFKESIHINSGLLSLGNVISSLGDPKRKCNHIPYRDSKITRILKDSLGGNAKTVMICCISPASSSFDETLNALKYANRARNIKNKPVINRDIQSIRFEEMQTEIMALREELARQRTGITSAVSDDHFESNIHIKEMEDKITRLQTECAHYRMIAEEAYKQLQAIQHRNVLSRSMDLQIQDWLQLMEEIKNKVPATLTREDLRNQTIRDLETELHKCHSDLKSDEEIFAEKSREAKQLQEHLQQMELACQESAVRAEEWQERSRQQDERLVQQQVRIQELEAALEVAGKASALSDSSVMDSATVVSSLLPSSSRRPKSVPAQLRSSSSNNGGLRPPSRQVKTSPALFSLDRVMQSFRARSQLLVSRLEDSDEVLHQTFSDDGEEVVPEPQSSTLERRGTFRIKKASKQKDLPSCPADVDNMETLQASTRLMEVEETETGSRLINCDVASSTEQQRKRIKQAQLKILEANQKVRDLSINIRMKEQLICELVKSGKDAELMNKQYAEKIRALEREKEQARQEVLEMQAALQDLEVKEQHETAEKQKLQIDYKKKMEAAKQKMTALQRKQKETEKVAQFAYQHEKKIHDLEMAVERMKQQQEILQRKLKEEAEQKAKLEREMQKEIQRVKELELRSEQQQKVLKRKTEEIAAVQRRLRSASTGSNTAALPPISGEEYDRLDEQRKELDAEVERVLAERQKMLELQDELRRREDIVAKKETLLVEKSELEIRKMRSSTMLEREMVAVSTRLDTVEQRLEERKQELSQLPAEQRHKAKEEIQRLRHKRDKLHAERLSIEGKLQDGKILSDEEERRLIELEEGMDALDAAIQYKNDTINSRQMELRQSQILNKSEDNLVNRLSALTPTESQSMLSRYFDKVISLREAERRLKLQNSEMEVKTEELERLIHELDNALQRSGFELDRRLTQQQQEYEKKMQMLMHQLMMADSNSGNVNPASVPTGDTIASASVKIQQLEKDLYFYKKTSRDLKKKIRELFCNGKLPTQMAEEIGISLVSNSVQSVADSECATPRSNNVLSSVHRVSSANSVRHPHPEFPSGSNPPTAAGTPRNRSSSQDHSGAASGSSSTPVKISRKDLRAMSEEEVLLRRSGLSRSVGSASIRDSLEGK